MKDAVKTTTNNNNRNETTMKFNRTKITTRTTKPNLVAALADLVAYTCLDQDSLDLDANLLAFAVTASTSGNGTNAAMRDTYNALADAIDASDSAVETNVTANETDAPEILVETITADEILTREQRISEAAEEIVSMHETRDGDEPTAEEIAQDEADAPWNRDEADPEPTPAQLDEQIEKAVNAGLTTAPIEWHPGEERLVKQAVANVAAPKTDGLAALNALFAAGSNDLGDTTQAEKTSTWEAKQAEAVAAYTSKGKTTGSTEAVTPRKAKGPAYTFEGDSIEAVAKHYETGAEVTIVVNRDGTASIKGKPGEYRSARGALKASGAVKLNKAGIAGDAFRLLKVNGVALATFRVGYTAPVRKVRAAKILTVEQATARVEKAHASAARAQERLAAAVEDLTVARSNAAQGHALAVSEGA